MKQKLDFLKRAVALFMACTIFLTSCGKFSDENSENLATVKQLSTELEGINLDDLESLYCATGMTVIDHREFPIMSMEDRYEVIANYLEEQTGYVNPDENAFASYSEDIEHYVQQEDFATSVSLLQSDEHISAHQAELLLALDEEMSAFSEDAPIEEMLPVVEDFETQVQNDEALSEEEKTQLLVFSTAAKANAKFMGEFEEDTRGPCWNCIKKNKWKIFGWAALNILIYVLLCLWLVAPNLVAACIIGGAVLSFFFQICWKCGDDCSWC
jgi:hypothetical protein